MCSLVPDCHAGLVRLANKCSHPKPKKEHLESGQNLNLKTLSSDCLHIQISQPSSQPLSWFSELLPNFHTIRLQGTTKPTSLVWVLRMGALSPTLKMGYQPGQDPDDKGVPIILPDNRVVSAGIPVCHDRPFSPNPSTPRFRV